MHIKDVGQGRGGYRSHHRSQQQRLSLKLSFSALLAIVDGLQWGHTLKQRSYGNQWPDEDKSNMERLNLRAAIQLFQSVCYKCKSGLHEHPFNTPGARYDHRRNPSTFAIHPHSFVSLVYPSLPLGSNGVTAGSIVPLFTLLGGPCTTEFSL
jgi:hypothetical protein